METKPSKKEKSLWWTHFRAKFPGNVKGALGKFGGSFLRFFAPAEGEHFFVTKALRRPLLILAVLSLGTVLALLIGLLSPKLGEAAALVLPLCAALCLYAKPLARRRKGEEGKAK